ncbi:MAG TPA: YrzI family small protein [Bacillus sp. (in: firmicutes)]|nr:YrzI family small protein [Bacillus sp. (in: firmicutes)]
MTLNLFFLTITVTRRPLTTEEIEHEQRLREIEEEIMNRKYEFYRMF